MNSWTSRSQEGKMAGASGYGNGLKWWMVDGGMLTVLPAFWKWRVIMISCALFASCNMFFFCMSRFFVIWCNLHVALRRSSHITFPESFAARDLGQSTKRSHKRYKSLLRTHNSISKFITSFHLKSPANPMISYCWEFTPFFFGWLPCSRQRIQGDSPWTNSVEQLAIMREPSPWFYGVWKNRFPRGYAKMDVGQNGRPRGPQMWMSSLVLTIQLLGYLILTHTQIVWDLKPWKYGDFPL